MYFAVILLVIISMASNALAEAPNIIFIMADDLGFNDVGYNNDYMITPNIDSLAEEGVKLGFNYMQPLCSPSRSAVMSGKYPFRTGLQHGVIGSLQPVCLNTSLDILPLKLKSLNYSTHLVGKWHLGYCETDCLPNHRGFDSFYGLYNGGSGHYDHEVLGALDLHDDDVSDSGQDGVYSTDLFTDKVIDIIENHDTDYPLFVDLAYQAPHSPLEVNSSYLDLYPTVNNTYGRQTYMAMVTALDEGIGKIVDALKAKNIYDNTLIIFTSDNGGDKDEGGNNYPLRGRKGLLYEGGTRVPAFVSGAGLTVTNYTNNGIMHAVDWYATIVGLAGGSTSGIDGVDNSNMILNGGASLRTQMVYNLDNAISNAFGYKGAIRDGKWKLIIGRVQGGWYAPDEQPAIVDDEPRRSTYQSRQLFDLDTDPYEEFNVVSSYQSIASDLRDILDAHLNNDAVTPLDPANDPAGDPSNFGDEYSTGWC